MQKLVAPYIALLSFAIATAIVSSPVLLANLSCSIVLTLRWAHRTFIKSTGTDVSSTALWMTIPCRSQEHHLSISPTDKFHGRTDTLAMFTAIACFLCLILEGMFPSLTHFHLVS